jgi:hypothetical protein
MTNWRVRLPVMAAERPRLGRWSVPFFRSRDRLLHRHRFRSLGKLVVGNLDWIADVHNIGN